MNFLIEYLLIIGKNLLKNKFYAYTRKTTLIVKKEALEVEIRNMLEVLDKVEKEMSNLDDCWMGRGRVMIDKKFKQILARNNYLKKIRIHDLRHSHASLLINQGEDYLVVKERLGHASITTTIDTYSHLYPSKQKTLANKLDDIF